MNQNIDDNIYLSSPYDLSTVLSAELEQIVILKKYFKCSCVFSKCVI